MPGRPRPFAERDVVLAAVVGHVEVVRPGRVLGGQGVDLLDRREEAQRLAPGPDAELGRSGQERDLLVGEALPLGLEEKVRRDGVETPALEAQLAVDDRLDLVEEPAVDPGQLVDAVDGEALLEGLGDAEEPLVGRLAELLLEVPEGIVRVGDEAVDADLEHPGGLLDGLLEGPADGHDLADRFHLRADLLRDAAELLEVPAGDLDDEVVEGGLEAGGRDLGDRVRQAGQGVAEGELGGDEGQRVARGLAGQGGAARQPGVDLDDAVVAVAGIEGVLDVALADDAEVADGLEGDGPEAVVLLVRQRLRRGDDDALPGVDAHGIEVLHVADRDAVVGPVPDDFVLDLLPAVEVLLDEDLGRGGEGPAQGLPQLPRRVGDAAALASEGVGDPGHDRVADRPGRPQPGFDRPDGDAPGRLEAGLGQGPVEELAVLGLFDGLHRRPEDGQPGLGQGAALPQGDAAVEGRLAAEREQEPLGLLPGDDLPHEEGRDRQEIDPVGHALGGLDRGDVGVDQDDLEPLLLEGLDGLAAGIIELAGLPDLERPAPEEKDLLRLLHPAASRKVSKRNSVSVGPGQASGWNWTPNTGRRTWRMPSFVPSLALRNQARPAARQAGRVHGEAVVLAGDVAALGALFEAGLVLAAVAELELVGRPAGGQGQDLVAEADPEEGNAGREEPADRGHRGRRPLAGRPGRWR